MAQTNKKFEHEFKILRATEFEDGGRVFDLQIDGDIKMYGLRVVSSRKGDFISFPSYQGKDKKYYSHCWMPLDEDDTEAILDMVQDALDDSRKSKRSRK